MPCYFQGDVVGLVCRNIGVRQYYIGLCHVYLFTWLGAQLMSDPNNVFAGFYPRSELTESQVSYSIGIRGQSFASYGPGVSFSWKFQTWLHFVQFPYSKDAGFPNVPGAWLVLSGF